MRLATCACGALQAACEGEPTKSSLCHCPQCQKRTGSAFGVAVFFPREAVTLSGPASSWTRAADSGFPVTQRFCPTCGSTVVWEPQRKPEVVAVALGAFADPGFAAPSQAVYEQHRHPWVSLAVG